MNREKNLRILEAYSKKYKENNIYYLCSKVAKLLGFKNASYPIKHEHLNLFFNFQKYKGPYGRNIDVSSNDKTTWFLEGTELYHLFTHNRDNFFKKAIEVNRS